MCPACMFTMTHALAAAAPAGALIATVVARSRRRGATESNPGEEAMESPRIVSQAEWLVARKALLTQEKASTRERDALAAARRRMPMVAVDKEYVFDGANGCVSLRDLFRGRSQLIVYHFMFDPAWEEGCKSCSHLADNVDGTIIHLAARHTSFAAISRASISKIEAFKSRMGWRFPWYSSGGNDFNIDFGVTVDVEGHDGSPEYNYERANALFTAGKIWFPKGELPGISVFLRRDDRVFHTYSTYQRGLDLFLNTYNLLDVTPLGRQEEDGRIQAWIRHHDRYPEVTGDNNEHASTY